MDGAAGLASTCAAGGHHRRGVHRQAAATVDADNAADTIDKIALTGSRTITSVGQMTLDSTTNGLERSGATSPVTFAAESGILLNDIFASANSGQLLHFNADSNGSGSGTFTLVTGKSITSNNGKRHQAT